jgi:hypothetical protein
MKHSLSILTLLTALTLSIHAADDTQDSVKIVEKSSVDIKPLIKSCNDIEQERYRDLWQRCSALLYIKTGKTYDVRYAFGTDTSETLALFYIAKEFGENHKRVKQSPHPSRCDEHCQASYDGTLQEDRLMQAIARAVYQAAEGKEPQKKEKKIKQRSTPDEEGWIKVTRR